MTYQDALRNTKEWHKRALLINIYHMKMLLRNKRWTYRHTAKRLDISLGLVSESIKLAKAMNDDPMIEQMKRNDALRRIK
jgi:hypothetical protein